MRLTGQLRTWVVGAGLCGTSLLLLQLPTPSPSLGHSTAPLFLAPLLLAARFLPTNIVLTLFVVTGCILFVFLADGFSTGWFVMLVFLPAVDLAAVRFGRRQDILLTDLITCLFVSSGAFLLIRTYPPIGVEMVSTALVADFALGTMISIALVECLRVTPIANLLTMGGPDPTPVHRPTLLQIIELAAFLAVLAALAISLVVVAGEILPLMVIANLALACILLVVARTLFTRFAAPINGLATTFDQWRAFNTLEGGSGALLHTIATENLSAIEDIYALQVGFSSLAKDIVNGERRLSTIAANYDELLRSLPLGVLAIDADSRIQFLNDALGEITHHRQDALASLHKKSAEMLVGQNMVEEWQLILEDAPPKSLLLVVTHRLDERGQGSGFWAIVTDITEQKQTNAQLIQASKLATLGEMSTGMAHELNQPLNVISLAVNNLRFSMAKASDEPSIKDVAKLDRIEGAVRRAASIIDHMRAFGRLSGEGLAAVQLGEVVAGSCSLMSEQLKLANIDLVNRFPIDSCDVMGNNIQLEQVVINLINNAKDAITEQGPPGEIVLDAEFTEERVLLRVTDTGGGIPEDVLPHVFEPFFTTKPVGKGTGLGGSISYGIIRDMQGDIWAENLPQGARITVSLPLLQSKSQIANKGEPILDGLDQ